MLNTHTICDFLSSDPNEDNINVCWKASTKENPCYVSITGKGPLTLHNERLNADGVLFWEGLREKFTMDTNSA